MGAKIVSGVMKESDELAFCNRTSDEQMVISLVGNYFPMKSGSESIQDLCSSSCRTTKQMSSRYSHSSNFWLEFASFNLLVLVTKKLDG